MIRFISTTLVTGLLLLGACTEQNGGETQQRTKIERKKVEVVKRVPAVCIWDGGSVREGPTAKANWVSSLALGERVTWLGISEPDSTNQDRVYHKIELSDSTVGWASEYVLAIDAEPAVVKTPTPLFRRPDLITVTEKELEPLDFLAILESDGKWIRVVGKENKKKGWIKLESISVVEEDVAVGVLVNKALALKEREKRLERLQSIIDNPVFSSSTFIDDVRKIYREQRDND